MFYKVYIHRFASHRNVATRHRCIVNCQCNIHTHTDNTSYHDIVMTLDFKDICHLGSYFNQETQEILEGERVCHGFTKCSLGKLR